MATESPLASAEPAPELSNGVGGFAEDGREYVISGAAPPPVPWSNVVANERFGFACTDSGTGYTWSGNSHENRLTPWRNDPVGDPPGEALFVRDEKTGAFWSATYYVRDGGVADDPSLGGEFEIQDPRGIAPAMLAPLIAFAVPGGQSVGASELIRPCAGLMVMFPSWLSHGVRPYAGNDVRISIALNLTPA